ARTRSRSCAGADVPAIGTSLWVVMGPADYTARVDEAASFVVGQRVELVPAAVVRADDVDDLDAAPHEVVRDEAAVTPPRHGLGAHDRHAPVELVERARGVADGVDAHVRIMTQAG